MRTLLVNLPLRAALAIDDTALTPLGVEEVMLDSIECWDTIEVQLNVSDGSDDAPILAYLRALPV